ncbi:DUF956 family protein [uncultured Anaerococcus sp.]|uniref:DUF956 family protein n=1 Tax=uncultured Anaerococcus sp. TaxID=293428 RepID=UPI0025D0984A|nr:DUF956 family protein [uncultured Anaerococcus sp.]
MVQSQNSRVDLKIKANLLGGLLSRGDLLIGNKAIEYYNERDVRDFIQIPYKEIKLITASVILDKKISRFVIHTKANGDFIFNTKDNKKVLRAINKYLPDDKLRKSLTIMDYVKKIFKR